MFEKSTLVFKGKQHQSINSHQPPLILCTKYLPDSTFDPTTSFVSPADVVPALFLDRKTHQKTQKQPERSGENHKSTQKTRSKSAN
jgi:hypothetical protein